MLRNPLIVESPFDPTHRFQTSNFISPAILACLRLLIACYCFSALFYRIGRSAVVDHSSTNRKSLSYFTNLSYWGISCYFAVAAFHTGVYALRGKAPLRKWGKTLQWLHSLLYTTVVTLPFLVTVVYWTILAKTDDPFGTTYRGWSNVTVHALNSVFAFFEIAVPRTERPPWIHIPFLILILAGYLGVAYITKATKGFYTYSFLDPAGSKGRVAAYVFGIAIAIVIVFCIVHLLIWGRLVLCERVLGLGGKFSKKSREGEDSKGGDGRIRIQTPETKETV